MMPDPTDLVLNHGSIYLLRRLEGLLDLLISPTFELPQMESSEREPRSSHKASSGYPIDFELWSTLEQLAGAFRDSTLSIDQEFSDSIREEALCRFPTVLSFEEGAFKDVIEFLQSAAFIPHKQGNLNTEDFTRLIRQSRFDEVYESGRIVAALCRLKELCKPKGEDILRVLRFKSIFDSLTIEHFRSWNGLEPTKGESGVKVHQVPYPSYHPAVWEWSEAVYETKFYINPYRGEKSGNPTLHPRFLNIGAQGYLTPEAFFANADLDEVRQYMAICLRGEKWCDGHIAGEFERGVIQAAFQRLEQLFTQSKISL
jgi:hypothetical protein